MWHRSILGYIYQGISGGEDEPASLLCNGSTLRMHAYARCKPEQAPACLSQHWPVGQRLGVAKEGVQVIWSLHCQPQHQLDQGVVC